MVDRFRDFNEKQEHQQLLIRSRQTDYIDTSFKSNTISRLQRSNSRDSSSYESPTSEGAFKPAEKFEDLLRPRHVSKELGRGQLLSTFTDIFVTKRKVPDKWRPAKKSFNHRTIAVSA